METTNRSLKNESQLCANLLQSVIFTTFFLDVNKFNVILSFIDNLVELFD